MRHVTKVDMASTVGEGGGVCRTDAESFDNIDDVVTIGSKAAFGLAAELALARCDVIVALGLRVRGGFTLSLALFMVEFGGAVGTWLGAAVVAAAVQGLGGGNAVTVGGPALGAWYRHDSTTELPFIDDDGGGSLTLGRTIREDSITGPFVVLLRLESPDMQPW